MNLFTWILVVAAVAVVITLVWGLVRPSLPRRTGSVGQVGMGGDGRDGYRGASPDPNGPQGPSPF
ncbi:hypothetical protein [Nocardioides sp. NPDC006273]|uniref:hypothetical protein n=1 Tax=Nocardioides sp. NPDC006273 TaxID=3155598 RepID=UPI0033A3D72C